MVNNEPISQKTDVTVTTTANAVGVPNAPNDNRRWYVAIVQNFTELACESKLLKAGYECFVPAQIIYDLDPKSKTKKRVLMPTLLLVRVTEKERRQIVALPFIKRFLTDRANRGANDLHAPVAIVKDYEVEQLKRLVSQNEIPVTLESIKVSTGDKVVIVSGALKGIEGIVKTSTDGTMKKLVISIGILGNATMTIPASLLRKA